jgi:hypothetical protein
MIVAARRRQSGHPLCASSVQRLGVAALVSAAAACAFTSAHDGCSVRAAIGEHVIVAGAVADHSDSTITIAICMEVPATRRVGSYHGELTFPAAGASVVHVTKPPVGMRVENVLVAGRVNFAGALPDGMGSGELLTLVLRTAGHGDGVPTRLRMLEINDMAGNNLLPLTRVDSLPSTAKAARSAAGDDPESQRELPNARSQRRRQTSEPIGVASVSAHGLLEARLLASTRPHRIYLYKLVLRQET